MNPSLERFLSGSVLIGLLSACGQASLRCQRQVEDCVSLLKQEDHLLQLCDSAFEYKRMELELCHAENTRILKPYGTGENGQMARIWTSSIGSWSDSNIWKY